MIRKHGRALLCALAVMGVSAVFCGTAMAEEPEAETEQETALEEETEEETEDNREKIKIPYEQEGAWDELTMTNAEVVETGINIRTKASEDGEVIGFLYPGTAAWVINKGEEWTELCSGPLTGFVRNEYLIYKEDIAAVAEEYGIRGVMTMWDDVNLFEKPDGDADILDVLSARTYFKLLEDQGHWQKVRYGKDGEAYLSEDDVENVWIFDTAIVKEGVILETEAETEEPEEDYQEPDYTEPSDNWVPETDPPHNWYPPQTEAPETNPPQTNPPETNPPQTNPPETDPPQTNPPETVPPTTEGPSGGDDDPFEADPDIWYNADDGHYYDADGNIVG